MHHWSTSSSLRVRLVADLEHRAAVLDAIAVDVAAEELAPVQSARDASATGA
jgi:hypothetical protein